MSCRWNVQHWFVRKWISRAVSVWRRRLPEFYSNFRTRKIIKPFSRKASTKWLVPDSIAKLLCHVAHRKHSLYSCSISRRIFQSKMFVTHCIASIQSLKWCVWFCIRKMKALPLKVRLTHVPLSEFQSKTNMKPKQEKFKNTQTTYIFTNWTLWIEGTSIVKSQILNKVAKREQEREDESGISKDSTPSPIRITLASLDEYNCLLQNGLDFYGATFFPTEASLELAGPVRIATKKGR